MALKSVGILAVLALIIPSASMVLSRRRATEHSRKKEEGDEAFTDLLYPFLDDSAPPDYPGLWSAIGGVAGVLRMNGESIKAIGVARGLRKSDPDYTDRPAREVFWTAIALWAISLVCLTEAFSARNSPSSPRAISLWTARLYCEMKSTLRSVKDFRDRSLNFRI